MVETKDINFKEIDRILRDKGFVMRRRTNTNDYTIYTLYEKRN
ncbi:MAG: hypothetical protein QXZ23_03395 [Saccharolobus sp.]